ncbi:MAG: T9SS type A sorting domain-containing protein [Bacteroidia bacterium]|nr:T9SS type A sorting domain-containing protein [Bacteroidia bacterium]NNC86421.1 T9SS type A sorting domain-containing protein [Bacteroidia bacterium]NNM16593.1 T9SS type A sorting domain-containing protein [Bacteroidia bacterium]
MRKLILFTIAGMLSFGAQAQDLVLSNYTVNHNGNTAMGTIDAYVTIENHSPTDSLFVLAERTVNNLATNHINLFCYGINCYPPSTSLSPDVIGLGPGDSDNTFKSQLLTGQSVGVSEVKYCFYDQGSTSDSVCVRFVYDITVVGVEDIAKDATFSNASPNPANRFTAFTYDLKGNTQNFEIQVYNMLGSVVKTVQVPQQRGALIINTAELENGVYFCSLVSEGKTYLTQKLLVTR